MSLTVLAGCSWFKGANDPEEASPSSASPSKTMPSAEASPAGAPSADSPTADGTRLYVLKDSDTQALTAERIANLDSRILELARNEIYARHGHIFKREDLQDYFESKPWYEENSEYQDQLSPVEKQNVELLHAYEAKYAAYKLESDLPYDHHSRHYRGDASFKRQQMEIDLNGDGLNEQVRLIPPDSELGSYQLQVNEIVIETPSELLPYFDIVDLNIDDPFYEIAVQMDSKMDFFRITSFYSFNGETVQSMGDLPDFSAHTSMYDGHGKVISAQQSRDFQSWFHDDAVFRLDADRVLKEEPQDFYPMEPPTPLRVIKALTVQLTKEDTQTAYNLQPGDQVKFLGGDEQGVAKLQLSTGKEVWYDMGDDHVVLTDYFDGLILYD